jgi:hypothetical protein
MPFDLFNYLLRQRIIFLAGYVNDKVSGAGLVGFLVQGSAIPEIQQ